MSQQGALYPGGARRASDGPRRSRGERRVTAVLVAGRLGDAGVAGVKVCRPASNHAAGAVARSAVNSICSSTLSLLPRRSPNARQLLHSHWACSVSHTCQSARDLCSAPHFGAIVSPSWASSSRPRRCSARTCSRLAPSISLRNKVDLHAWSRGVGRRSGL